MIGGSIPGLTKVASIAIFESTESLEYGQAGLLSLVLLIISYVALLAIGRQGIPEYRRQTPHQGRKAALQPCYKQRAVQDA